MVLTAADQPGCLKDGHCHEGGWWSRCGYEVGSRTLSGGSHCCFEYLGHEALVQLMLTAGDPLCLVDLLVTPGGCLCHPA